MAKKVFVFDLDDTLIDNVHDYAEPIIDMARIIIVELRSKAPHISTIIALEEEIDKRRVHEINPATGQKFLYSKERFPGSLVETYNAICRKVGLEPRAHTQQDLYKAGVRAFDKNQYRKNIHPSAFDVINFLYEQGDIPMLLSKGDKDVQSNKFAALDAYNTFERAKIVDIKTSETFRQMLAGYNGYKAYSVGNDYEKDIVPALEVEYQGVFIPVENWETTGRMDEIMALVDRSRCVVLKDLSEFKERYGEL